VKKRALAGIAIGLVLSGCGAIINSAGPTSGRVAGHVTVRACGGANTENQTGCQAHPSPGVKLAFKETASSQISYATTDAAGAYNITLPAGNYEVTLQPGDTPWTTGDHGPPRKLTVVAAKTVTADFGYTIQLL